MKSLFIIFTLLFSFPVFAQEVPKNDQMIKELKGKRIPSEDFSTKYKNWFPLSFLQFVNAVSVVSAEGHGSGILVQGGYFITASHVIHNSRLLQYRNVASVDKTQIKPFRPGTLIRLDLSTNSFVYDYQTQTLSGRIVMDLPDFDFTIIYFSEFRNNKKLISLNQIADRYPPKDSILAIIGYGGMEKDQMGPKIISKIKGLSKLAYSKEVEFVKNLDKEDIPGAQNEYEMITTASASGKGDSGGAVVNMSDLNYYGIFVSDGLDTSRKKRSAKQKHEDASKNQLDEIYRKIAFHVPLYLVNQVTDFKNLLPKLEKVDFSIEKKVFEKVCAELGKYEQDSAEIVLEPIHLHLQQKFQDMKADIATIAGCE